MHVGFHSFLGCKLEILYFFIERQRIIVLTHIVPLAQRSREQMDGDGREYSIVAISGRTLAQHWTEHRPRRWISILTYHGVNIVKTVHDKKKHFLGYFQSVASYKLILSVWTKQFVQHPKNIVTHHYQNQGDIDADYKITLLSIKNTKIKYFY